MVVAAMVPPAMLDAMQSLVPPPAPRLPGRGECRWPLWDHRERPDHRHCCEPVVAPGVKGAKGAYCAEHAAAAIRVLAADGARAEPEPMPQPAPVPRAKPAPRAKAPPKPREPKPREPRVFRRWVLESLDVGRIYVANARAADSLLDARHLVSADARRPPEASLRKPCQFACFAEDAGEAERGQRDGRRGFLAHDDPHPGASRRSGRPEAASATPPASSAASTRSTSRTRMPP